MRKRTNNLLIFFALTIGIQKMYSQEIPIYPICHSASCSTHGISANIDETTGNPNIPMSGPGLNIIPTPPTTVDWTDLLNSDGTSKGAIPINPDSDITISATLVGGATLIAPNGFHHPPQSSSTITVTLSDTYNLKGRAFYIGTPEYVESSDINWDKLLNATVTGDNRLVGVPAPQQGNADYYIENVSSFQVTIGNNHGVWTLSQNLTVPTIHLPQSTTGPTYTNLWGGDGSNQQGDGLIPEFSFAGYKSGYERPKPPVSTVNVTDFGATGDGSTDDTQAIKDAIASIDSGGVYFPQGTYVITDFIDIEKSNIYLVGADKSNTTLYFPNNLTDVLPDQHTPETSNYSWSGGFIRFIGTHGYTELSTVTQEAEKGATRIYVADTSSFFEGQEIRFRQNGNQITSYMAGDTVSYHNWPFYQLLKVTCIGVDYIDIDRPLRIPIILTDPSGGAKLYKFEPTVRGGGISNLTFEFPNTVYGGHWTEKGYNAIELTNTVDIIIDNINIHNADSGIFARTGNMHNELTNITLTSERVGWAGHHGILAGNDMLMKNIIFNTSYLHDFTVTRGSSGNVFTNNSGIDLNTDFHHGAPYETLITDSDVGAGGGRWLTSSGGGYGYHSGKGTVLWNVRSSAPLDGPPEDFAPPGSLVMTGLDFGHHFGQFSHHTEYIRPEDIRPQNLYEAQLIRRYANIFIKEGEITDDKTFVSTSGNVLIVDSTRMADCYELPLVSQWQKRTFSETDSLWGNWEDVQGETSDTIISQNVNQSTQYRRNISLENYPIYTTSDTVTLQKIPCTPDSTVYDGIFIDAETALIQGDWEIENDPDASGDYYVVNNISNQVPITDTTTALSYNFTVEDNGNYKVWGRTIAPHGGDNSFWIKIDDGDWIYWSIYSYSTDWKWNVVFDDTNQDVPTFNLTSGTHQISIHYRENGAKLDKLYIATEDSATPVDPDVITDNTKGIYLEAECTNLAGNWEMESDIDASGGSYVVNNISNQDPVTDTTTALTYHFTVEEAGAYNVWGRIIAPHGGDNSLWIKIDDEDWIYWSIYSYSTDWKWNILFDDNKQAINTFNLTPGTHQISIHYRENGTKLDKIYIAGVNACNPSGTGATAGNCTLPSCTDIQLQANLEGAYDNNTGQMSNTLQSRGLLPGQTPVSPLATPTPAGQPYSIAPWNYTGTEGINWTDTNYTSNETDWILVSFRTGITKDTEVTQTAALIMQDGVIELVNRCALSSSISDSLYIVLQHRNHIGIMTPQPVEIVNGILTYDFRASDSYRDPTSFGQKQLSNGEWAMFAGDANQMDFPSFDVNGTDKTEWFDNNGVFDYYLSPDFNLDGDVNGQDKSLWFENNGISSRVSK